MPSLTSPSLPILDWSALSPEERTRALTRSVTRSGDAVRERVSGILKRVRAEGDAALFELTETLDKVALQTLRVQPEEFQRAEQTLEPEALAAIQRAARQIRGFHQPQLNQDYSRRTSPGIECSRLSRPIEAVGLYAPGGTAPLPSTVLMLGVPARLAGCPTRVLCTPPNAKGEVPAAILVAAMEAGITDIFKLGGAQAIAAMAFGTATVPRVDKLFGPGNAWVTEAKLQASLAPGGAACDMPAGPSEVLVIADEGASPEFVAADLLSQAEHGTDSHVVLLSTSSALCEAVQQALEEQLDTLSRRDIARESIHKSVILKVGSLSEAVEVSNRYAPEHLIIQTENPRALLDSITNAGSVFLGPWSPEAVGDYASGTNHVLPTYGHARAYSGLSVDAFQKKITVQELSPAGLLDIGPVVETLATLEGLDAHGQAVTRRLAALRSGPVETSYAEDTVGLARRDVLDLTPYVSARSQVKSADTLLDANENPLSPLSEEDTPGGINRYPEPQPKALLSGFATLYNVGEERLILGRGSDDIIDCLLRAFCDARRDSILICPPTYGVYGVAAELQGAGVVEVPLRDDFSLNLDEVVAQWHPGVKLVFLCSPNNPTGTVIPTEEVATLCERLAGRALVVVDEAYQEFAETRSALTLLPNFDNLLVLRTLSKGWGLAGARCGVGVGDPRVISLLQKVRAPYPLTTPSINAIAQVLTPAGREKSEEHVALLNRERERLNTRLLSLPEVLEVVPSAANFLLVRTQNASHFVERCAQAGIIVRDRSSQFGLTGCVRVTVGTSEQTDALLAALTSQENPT